MGRDIYVVHPIPHDVLSQYLLRVPSLTLVDNQIRAIKQATIPRIVYRYQRISSSPESI
jgi:hypothetical protein